MLRIFTILICFLLFISCGNPTDSENTLKPDILEYEDENGILSTFEFEKSNYNLDETVTAKLITYNNSDSHRVHIYSNGGPLYSFLIYSENKNNVADHLPRFRTRTIYNFYFSPGDSYKSTLKWDQLSYSTGHFSDLKSFSGEYFITGSQPGLSINKVGKWINISEEGEPLSSKLYWYISSVDSIKLDFLLRNRISNKLEYFKKANESITLQFYEYGNETPVKELVLESNISTISLQAKSDNKILTYSESEEKLKQMGLHGSLYCTINIPCESRNIEAKGFVVVN